MSTESKHWTFISYSRKDKDFALELARALKSAGHLVWLDQLDIPTGARWDDEVERALRECHTFLVILTVASTTSENVKDEIGYAIDHRKRIIPVFLEECDIPLRLRRFQYVDFTKVKFDEGVIRVKKLLEDSLNIQPIPAAPSMPHEVKEPSKVEEVTSIDERKQFTKFFQSLWATLAGISVLFPISNVLAKVIPLAQWPQGGFAYFNPTLVTAISTMTCLFIILSTFGRRQQFAYAKRRRLIKRESALSFVVGAIGLIVYLIGHFAVAQDFYYIVFYWASTDLRRVFGDLLLLIAYCVFFAFMTRAFMLLGMLEYYGSKRRAA